MSIRRIALLLMTLAVVFAMSVGLVGAQTIPAEGKWTGEINAADASTLVVSGVRFQAVGVQVDAGLSLTPGTVVQIKFTAANGGLNAVKVERLEAGDDDLPGTGSVTGTIDSATADIVSIGGVPFNVVGATIDDDASLNAGSVLELDFTFNGTALTVNRIEAEDDEDDAKAIGVIETMDATTITVGGVAFDITGAQIDDDGILAVGTLVEIEFTVADDGRVIALDIEFEDDLSGDDTDDSIDDDDITADFVLSGRVEAIDGTRLTVNSITVDTNGADMDDDDTLVVGDAVTIYFQRDATGALTVIEVDEIDDVDDPFDDDRDDDDRDDSDDDDSDNDDSSDDDGVAVINGCVRPDGWQTYRVGRGDTLSRIAGAANTTVDALVAANCLDSASFIIVGQQLFVPISISRFDDDDDNRGADNDNDDDDDNDNDDDGDDDNGNDNDDDGDDNGNDNDDDDDDDDNGNDNDDDGDDD